MNKIFYLPLPSMDSRYTAQWRKWIADEIVDQGLPSGYELCVVGGDTLTDDIEIGSFLDLHSSMHYYYTQLAKVVKLDKAGYIGSGDKIFIPDIEMWGIEGLAYLFGLQHKNVKIYGFMHAGSYSHLDYMEPMAYIGRFSERAWVGACEKVFVGSQYHKDIFLLKRGIGSTNSMERKIVVTGNPFNVEDVRKAVAPDWNQQAIDANSILFAGRLDEGRGINMAIEIFFMLKKAGYTITITHPHKSLLTDVPDIIPLLHDMNNNGIIKLRLNVSKEEYYRRMAASRYHLSTTLEENFGYTTLEAFAFNTIALLPAAFSNKEVAGPCYPGLYNFIPNDAVYTGEQIIETLKRVQETEIGKIVDMHTQTLNHYNRSTERIVKEVIYG